MLNKERLKDILKCVKIDDLKFDEESLKIFKQRIFWLLEVFLEE